MLICGIALTLLFVSAPTSADIGGPMLAVIWPCSWLMLPVIVAVEAVIARWVLKCGWGTAFKASGVANGVSTFAGIPVAWILLVALQMVSGGSWARGLETSWTRLYAVTVQSPWLIPYQDSLSWLVPAAAASLCVPMFFMSVAVEYRVAGRVLGDRRSLAARRWAWIANLCTYAPVIIVLAFIALRAYLRVYH